MSSTRGSACRRRRRRLVVGCERAGERVGRVLRACSMPGRPTLPISMYSSTRKTKRPSGSSITSCRCTMLGCRSFFMIAISFFTCGRQRRGGARADGPQVKRRRSLRCSPGPGPQVVELSWRAGSVGGGGCGHAHAVRGWRRQRGGRRAAASGSTASCPGRTCRSVRCLSSLRSTPLSAYSLASTVFRHSFTCADPGGAARRGALPTSPYRPGPQLQHADRPRRVPRALP